MLSKMDIMNECDKKCLYITYIAFSKIVIVEKILAFFFRLYHTIIKRIESYVVVKQKFNDSNIF